MPQACREDLKTFNLGYTLSLELVTSGCLTLRASPMLSYSWFSSWPHASTIHRASTRPSTTHSPPIFLSIYSSTHPKCIHPPFTQPSCIHLSAAHPLSICSFTVHLFTHHPPTHPSTTCPPICSLTIHLFTHHLSMCPSIHPASICHLPGEGLDAALPSGNPQSAGGVGHRDGVCPESQVPHQPRS